MKRATTPTITYHLLSSEFPAMFPYINRQAWEKLLANRHIGELSLELRLIKANYKHLCMAVIEARKLISDDGSAGIVSRLCLIGSVKPFNMSGHSTSQLTCSVSSSNRCAISASHQMFSPTWMLWARIARQFLP